MFNDHGMPISPMSQTACLVVVTRGVSSSRVENSRQLMVQKVREVMPSEVPRNEDVILLISVLNGEVSC